jgi:hypothetical protein
MGLAARQTPTSTREGCFVCGDWKDEMIHLVDHATTVCRPCGTRVGRAILAMSPTVVARLWPASRSVRETRPATPQPADVGKHLGTDALAHLDLAQAYGEMGLMEDALRTAATALEKRAPLPIASQALNWMFSPGRAEPDALPTVARILRSE